MLVNIEENDRYALTEKKCVLLNISNTFLLIKHVALAHQRRIVVVISPGICVYRMLANARALRYKNSLVGRDLLNHNYYVRVGAINFRISSRFFFI